MWMRTRIALCAFALLATASHAPSFARQETASARSIHLPAQPLGAMRGVTVGPIENALHADKGYGSDACEQTMVQVRSMGGTWVSLTPFGKIWDLSPSGVTADFEAATAENRDAVRRAIVQAHAQGLKVMLVPHLWVESGGWRGELDFATDDEWARFSNSYRRFVLHWAKLAEETSVELYSVGVELRSWVTSTRAFSFVELISSVRDVYSGPLTYAANWDDAETTTVWGHLDVIGINAFFPLAQQPGAPLVDLYAESARIASTLGELSARYERPVLFTEMGYTARKDAALRPWEWPEDLGEVQMDVTAQAEAYAALLAPMVEKPWFLGFFVWRVYADPFDASQEPAWGFSPLYKPAEQALRSAFETRWANDGYRYRRGALD